MIDLVLIYKWSILSGIIVGCALTLSGAQLAARKQSVQSLVLSEAASLGIIIALMIEIIFFPNHKHQISVFPIVSGLLIAFTLYYVFNHIKLSANSFKNTYYITIFTLLLSVKYLFTSITPGLHSHSSSSYIGDLALISDREAQFISFFAFIIFTFLYINWGKLTNISFLKNTFSHYLYSSHQKKINALFNFLNILLIVLSIELLGMVFTLAYLFIPTVILSIKEVSISSLKFKLISSVIFGTVIGIFTSFNFEKLPTVPTLAIMLTLTSYVFSLKTKRLR